MTPPPKKHDITLIPDYVPFQIYFSDPSNGIYPNYNPLPLGPILPELRIGDFNAPFVFDPNQFRSKFGFDLTFGQFPTLWSPTLPFNLTTPKAPNTFVFPWPAQPQDPFPMKDVKDFKFNFDINQSIAVWEEIHGLKKTNAEKWIDFLSQLFNNVYSLDIDFENLPVNRGKNLSRFSEYAPVGETKREPSIKIFEGTTARAHGEIRPIKGKNESWITRVGWDFTPNVFYMDKTKPLPDLEIDGATAVDPPIITYDFKKGRKSVLTMDGGDYSYENPQVSGAKPITPFGTIVDAPPGGHNYWMFRFNPVTNDALGGLMESASNGSLSPTIKSGMGALLLWAFLPTVGFVGEQRYKDVGVPYNTLPRRFGDLITMLSPMFDGPWAEDFRQAAPFYNPNSEFIMPLVDDAGMLLPKPKNWRAVIEINETRKKDCEERRLKGTNNCLPLTGRQPIPDDPLEFAKIDKILTDLGLDRIPRKRGAILDWVFTDLAKDPERLKKMKDFPRATLHMKMRETTLDTPFGKVKVDPTTDIRLNYYIHTVENPKTKRTEARIGIKVDIEPLKLEKADLTFGNYRFKANSLKSKKMTFQMPSIPGFSQEDPMFRPPMTVTLEGVEAEGLKVWDTRSNFNFEMGTGGIEKLDFSYQDEWKDGTVGEWKAKAPDDFNPEKCQYTNGDGAKKYGCYYQSEKGEWKPFTPQEFTGVYDLPDSTRVVYNREGNWKLDIKKIGGTDLEMDSAFGKINASQFDIPEAHLAVTLERRPGTNARGEPNESNDVRFLSLNIPEIKSNIGLNLKLKDSATALELKGSTILKDLKFFSENQPNQVHTQVSLDLSGIIESAQFINPIFGSAKFTTQEDKTHVHKITGTLRSTSMKPKGDNPSKPVTNFDLDLDLPYVGFETTGILNIPTGSSTLRNTKLKLSGNPELKVTLQGHIDLKNASHKGTEALELGRFKLTPNLTNIGIAGDFLFEFSPQGFSLKPAPGSADTLQIGFDLDGSKFKHKPDLTGKPAADLPESEVIETDVALESAKVRIAGLRTLEVTRFSDGDVKRNKVTQLDAGPITVHHLKGAGSIWVDLAIWGFVRGFFPMLGGTTKDVAKHPDAAPLTDHLPTDEKKALRDTLGSEDFLHFGSIKLETLPDTSWTFGLKDMLINVNEVGGRDQFGLVRLPEFNLSGGTATKAPKIDLGKGGFLLNIFLYDPERGGYFKIHRWPTKK